MRNAFIPHVNSSVVGVMPALLNTTPVQNTVHFSMFLLFSQKQSVHSSFQCDSFEYLKASFVHNER